MRATRAACAGIGVDRVRGGRPSGRARGRHASGAGRDQLRHRGRARAGRCAGRSGARRCCARWRRPADRWRDWTGATARGARGETRRARGRRHDRATAAEKARHVEATGAIAVDMESTIAGRGAPAAGLPFVAARLSDAARRTPAAPSRASAWRRRHRLPASCVRSCAPRRIAGADRPGPRRPSGLSRPTPRPPAAGRCARRFWLSVAPA